MSRLSSVDRSVYDKTVLQNQFHVQKMREADENISLRIRAERGSEVPEPSSQRVGDIVAAGDPDHLLRP